MKKPIFSIVIPNWNGKEFLRICLDSLFKQSFKNYEIILVDNGSSDDSVSFTKNHYPEVKIVVLKKNMGFAVAANTGIKEAKGGLVALLNNDTEVDKDWLREIFNASEKDNHASFFASKLLDFKNRKIIDSCGDGLSWSGRAFSIGKGKKDSPGFEDVKYVFGATAGAAVYKKEMLEKVGLFDEDFFMYLEDVDLDFRAQLMGFKCLFVPKAKVYHIGSATAGKNSAFVFKYITRNRWYLMKKNFPWQKVVTYYPLIIISELRFFIAAVRHGFLGEYFWAFQQVIRNRAILVRKKSGLMAARAVSFKQLDEVMK